MEFTGLTIKGLKIDLDLVFSIIIPLSIIPEGTINSSGLKPTKSPVKMIVGGLKNKLIERVLFYNLSTHKQTTVEAVLLLPPYFL